MEVGGGRIIGESCHLIDLISFLTGSHVESVSTKALGSNPKITSDIASIHLKYKNGSLGILNYLSNGHKSYAKERVEIFYQGRNIIIDNFRKTYAYGFSNSFKLSNVILKTKQDKGHSEQFKQLYKSWSLNSEPIVPFIDIINTTQASFAAIQSIIEKKEIVL
tara:strand:- start:287 stop:775 length:489 start_codon:yes stop_codon:yes gene_type:complete